MPVPITDIKPDSRFFGMLAGRSASGKTSISLSFPKPLLYVDFDMRIRGGLWLRELMDEEEFKQIDVEFYPPSRGFQDIYNLVNGWELECLSKSFKYKTVVIGSVTNSSRVFLSEIIELTGGRIIGGKKDREGHTKGGIRVTGPADYNIQMQAMFSMFDVLRSLTVNVICEAHIVDRYGRVKDPGDDNKIVPETIIGQKLTLTSNLGENILTYFDEVYLTEKEEVSGSENRFYIRFHSDIARTTFKQLPLSRVDVTGKNFYKWWKEQVSK